MTKLVHSGVRYILAAGLAFVFLFSATQPAMAQGIVYGDTVPAGTTLNNDAVLYGDTVEINGTINGDALAFGRLVTIDGVVAGSLVVVGETVVINGEVGGTVYAGTVNLELGPEANLARNLYYAGLSLVTDPSSVVGRDVLAATMGAQLAGEVNGVIRAIIGPLEFARAIMDAMGGDFTLPDIRLPGGNSNLYQVSSSMVGSPSLIALRNTLIDRGSIVNQQVAPIDGEVVGAWFLDRLRDLVTLFIFGLVGLWWMAKFITQAAEKITQRPLPSTGYGLLAMVIAFNLTGVVILLFAIILAIGLFLGFATMWELAWAFMALGFFGLGLVSTIFALFVLYISKAIVAYLVGSWILNKISTNLGRYKVLSLLLGLLIYVFLVAIPYLGWVISILVTAIGLGAAWIAYRERNKELPQTNDNAEPEIIPA